MSATTSAASTVQIVEAVIAKILDVGIVPA